MAVTFQLIHFNSGTKLFQAVIYITTLQASPLLNALPPMRHTTFETTVQYSVLLEMYIVYAFCCHING